MQFNIDLDEVAQDVAAVAVYVLTVVQHLDVLVDDVGGVALDEVVVGVLVNLRAAFDHAWSASTSPARIAL